MKARTFAGLLRQRALGADADGAAVRFTEASDAPDVHFSARNLWDAAERVGAALRRRGVEPGDRVLLLSPEVHACTTAHFGAWSIGVTPVHVGLPYRLSDPAAFVAHLSRTAELLGARRILVSSMVAAFAPSGKDERVVVIDDLLGETASEPLPDPDTLPAPDLVQLTSGSTGSPRAVVVPHERMLEHLRAIATALPAGEHASGVTWLPLYHDMGLIGGLLYPLFTGFPVRLVSPLVFQSRPWAWLEAMSEARATHTAGPPSAYALILRFAARAVQAGLRLDSLRCAMIGAEPVSPSLLAAFAEAFGPCGFRKEAFFPVYGLAEATVAVTFPRLLAPPHVAVFDRDALERAGLAIQREGEAGLGLTGLGTPLPGTELRIVDQDAQLLDEGRVGEIQVRSPSLMTRYDGEPEATDEVLQDGWLKTGDLGFVHRGDLFVTGRLKDVIIKGGHNVLPGPIEAIASSVDGVRVGCVVAVGIRDERRETENVVVVAETKLPESEWPLLDGRVRDALKLNGIHVDRVVLVPPQWLPRTTSGKHRRREVARRLSDTARL